MKDESMIRIAEKLSSDLALRNVADSFFDWLESLQNNKLTIDFSGVRSISRSFAHQYVLRKKSTRKIINEINVPNNVSKMLRIVENPSQKSDILNLDSIQVLTV